MMGEHAGPVRGAGGGGKSGGGGGVGGGEAADTLRSTQLADVVDLLGEGEFEGLTNGLQSIYYDGVPLQNADGSFNFQNVQVWFTPGTQGQASITGGDGVQTETGVGVDVVQATPVVRTITNPNVDKVRVTIAVPQLSDTNTSNGFVGGASFVWAIDVQSAGGGFVQQMQENVSGKVSSSYTRSKVLTLPGIAPWDVRVRRITADSASAYLANKFTWSSYTEIQSLKLRHPNSAMVRHRIDARQFSRIPVRSFDVMGARVQVPNNYDPKTKTYSGIWNGGFKIAWTDCPAWIYYALASHPRYGLGRYFPIGDGVKWDLYRIGQYCDQMVSDGRGGVEPRFRCGVQLTTREQAYKVLTDMAGIFRGMGYWMNSDVAVVQDAPSDPVALFTPSNVVGGKFSYAGASRSKRHTQVTVWFNDLAQQGKLVPEVVVDAALERRMGVRPLELSPLGCWSRGQAHRLGKWALYSEQYEGGTVNFRVGLDGVLVPPGKVFEVADPNEAGERLGGRVHSATASVVTLDAPVTLAAGESYLLSVMLQDPADPAKLVRQQRAVTTSAGVATSLAVVPAFSSAPAAESVWVLQSDQVQATTWRCLALAEVAGTNDHEISALRHYPQKYDLIENGIAFDLPPVSRINARAAKPTSLALAETVYMAGTAARSRATFSWHAPAPGLSFLVSWRLANGPWTDVPLTSSNTVEMDGLVPGLLEATVRSVNAIGNTSPAATVSLTLLGEAGASVRLAASVGAFAFDAAGAPKPAGQVITFTAQRVNLAGVAVITATGYAADGSGATALTLGGSGETRTLAVADFGAKAYAVVQATLDGHTTALQIGRTTDGAMGAAGVGATTLVPRGNCVVGPADVITKIGGVSAWDSDCSSLESFVGGAWCSFQAGQTYLGLMVGLNTDPATVTDPAASIDYQTLDFAWYCRNNGVAEIYESGGYILAAGAYSPDTVFSVTYDGAFVRYLMDGVLVRQVAAAAGLRLYLDSSFASVGAVARNVRFGPAGAAGSNAKLLSLTGDGSTFQVAKDGTASPSSITLTAAGQYLSGAPSFTVIAGVVATLTGGGNARALSYGAMSTDVVTVQASWDGQVDTWTVAKLREGSDGISRVVPNESHTLPADSAGVVSSYAGSGTPIQVYEGSTALVFHTSLAPGRFIVGTPAVSPAGSITVGARSGSGTTTCTVADHSGASNAVDVIVVTCPITARRANGTDVSFDVQQTLTKSKAGTDGAAGPGSTTLVPRGTCVLDAPDRIRKASGTNQWDSDCYSLESFVNGAWCSFQAGQTYLGLMVGLNTDPATVTDPAASIDYQTLDFAWYCRNNGVAEIYESGGYILAAGAYSPDTVFSVTYDGAFVRYLMDGVLVRQVAAAAGLRLYLDSSFASVGAVARNVRFGPAGAAGSNAKLLSLTGDGSTFQVAKDGTASPSSITLTAAGQYLSGAPSFTVIAGVVATLTGGGNARALSYGAMSTDVVTVQASWDGQVDTWTVAKLREGSDGISRVVPNESHTLPADSAGVVSSYAGSGTPIQVYEGSTALVFHTSLAPGRFIVGTPAVSPGGSITVGAVTGSGTATCTVADHSAASNAADVIVIAYPVTARRANGTDVAFDIYQTLTKSKAGAKGDAGTSAAPTVDMIVSPASITLPADAEGLVTDWSQASTTAAVNVNGVPDTAGSFACAASYGLSPSSMSGGTVSVLAMSVDAGWIDIAWSRPDFAMRKIRVPVNKVRSAVVSTLNDGASVDVSATRSIGGAAVARARFRADGAVLTIAQNNQQVVDFGPAWYVQAPVANIGATYAMRVVETSRMADIGIQCTGGLNTWLQITGDIDMLVTSDAGNGTNTNAAGATVSFARWTDPSKRVLAQMYVSLDASK